jgi:hypothetical protein
MTVAGDPVLDEMADQFRTALISHGLDPKNPPTESRPPGEAAFAEYQRRGGEVYTDPDQFIKSLIERVGSL